MIIQASADLGAAFESVSSHEADHLLQFISSGRKSYHFDYGLEGNMEKYGRKKPPVIDLSKITTKSLSIWYGEYDTLVSPADVRASLEDLRGEFDLRILYEFDSSHNNSRYFHLFTSVPYKEHYISSPGLFFNHGSFLFNRQADHWLNIPSYYEITH